MMGFFKDSASRSGAPIFDLEPDLSVATGQVDTCVVAQCVSSYVA
jgi:hypothetical protein